MVLALVDSDDFSARMRSAISLCWEIFSSKVGTGLIVINKEASMQLQYAYLLQQVVPLITFREDEHFEIELETGVKVGGRPRSVDLIFHGCCGDTNHTIAVEMKCYRTLASSRKPRGATDIFMKDVYFDFHLLEQYVDEREADEGVALVMTDMKRLVYPSSKDAKCWDYDISDGARVEPKTFDTPIGGKSMNFRLDMNYYLNWYQHGNFWFLQVQGETV